MTASQRAKLRSLGQTAPDLVFIGKDGLTQNVKKQVDDNLFARELVKVKVLKTCPQNIIELGLDLEGQCECEVVAKIGNKILLYKYSDKRKITHIL